MSTTIVQLGRLLWIATLAVCFGSGWGIMWGLVPGTPAADEVALTAADRETLERGLSLAFGDYRWPFPQPTKRNLAQVELLWITSDATTFPARLTPNLREMRISPSSPLTASERFHWDDLAGCAELSHLSGAALPITTLEPLRQFPHLRVLLVPDAAITSLEPLRDLEHLTQLDVNWGERRPLTTQWVSPRVLRPVENALDPAPLIGKETLTLLRMRARKQADIAPFLTLPNLIELDLSFNHLTSIAGIEQLTHLTLIDLTNNDIADLSPLLALPSLQEVRIWGNPHTETNIAVYRELQARHVLLR